MKKQFYFILCLFLTVSIACNKQDKIEKIQLNGAIFGTTFSVIYLDDETNYTEEINNLFEEINASLSTYIPTSDISKINDGDSSVIVDDYFIEVFEKSKKIYEETDGFFDPTVGVLVNAWGFGPKNEIENLKKTQIDSLLQFVGFDKVTIGNRKVIKAKSAIYLDFNSIAKGYAVDVVSRFLESKNVENYLVEIGGEIRSRGKNEDENFWKIGIDNPNADGTRTINQLVSLKNQSIASSGNYRKFRIDKEGNKFVHTINPKTGLAKESNLLAATVIGEMDCADADAYATAFMAMGLEKTKEYVSKNSAIKVILFYLNEDGIFEKYDNYTYN